ncbi:hypothetical protein [Natronoglomus mannanivorans]|uniref:Uncharacterized protein n=1 Tax=Natronoglomus mannanivorans TaxID=2979990 RepID=A0AAP3E1K8_9EURY|nr:hypothetical protein [Halobacteria archaeon AArc-xg1-1]
MSTTTTTQETVSDAQQGNVVIERPRPSYGYLGHDNNGNHHHRDRATNTVYVTENGYERFRPKNASVYWVRVHGEVHSTIDLESTDLEAWVDHVDSTTGWKAQPADLRVLLQRGGLR